MIRQQTTHCSLERADIAGRDQDARDAILDDLSRTSSICSDDCDARCHRLEHNERKSFIGRWNNYQVNCGEITGEHWNEARHYRDVRDSAFANQFRNFRNIRLVSPCCFAREKNVNVASPGRKQSGTGLQEYMLLLDRTNLSNDSNRQWSSEPQLLSSFFSWKRATPVAIDPVRPVRNDDDAIREFWESTGQRL
jgi:hypothetical protein